MTLAKTEIRAPFRARVGLRRVSEGAWITPETLLTTLQDTSRIKIDFTLPERYAGAVAIGQPFALRGRRAAASASRARVVAIEPAIDAPTRSLLVRGVSENPDGRAAAGRVRRRRGADRAARRRHPGAGRRRSCRRPPATPSTCCATARAELREVEIGLRTREAVEILRGLAVGDTVLTTNLLRLRPGARVEVAAPPTAGAS